MKTKSSINFNQPIINIRVLHWSLMIIAALIATMLISLFVAAKASTWDHSAANQCFNRWGNIAEERLNQYLAAGDKYATELYRYNEFGQVVDTHVAVQKEPSDYWDYENKFHWMWDHYYDGQYRWENPLWQDAGVPPMRTFVRHCLRKYDDAHWTRVSLKSAAYTVESIMSLERLVSASIGVVPNKKEMYVNPVYRGYRLSRCYADNTECTGLKTAYQFCRSRDYAGVDDYRLKRSVGPTRHLFDSQLCTSEDCDGFAWIRCSGLKSKHIQKINMI